MYIYIYIFSFQLAHYPLTLWAAVMVVRAVFGTSHINQHLISS